VELLSDGRLRYWSAELDYPVTLTIALGDIAQFLYDDTLISQGEISEFSIVKHTGQSVTFRVQN
jgi:hypothetical protein